MATELSLLWNGERIQAYPVPDIVTEFVWRDRTSLGIADVPGQVRTEYAQNRNLEK
jgi:hypothetical protein